MMGRNAKAKTKPPEKIKYHKGTYSVIQFINFDGKLFDCIPDSWFVDEEKTLCFWPPKSGKSLTLRAMNQEPEDEDWEVHECVSAKGMQRILLALLLFEKNVLNITIRVVHLEAEQFRRKHPGLIDKDQKSFENGFSSAKANKTLKDHREIDNDNLINHEKSQPTCNGGATHSYPDSQKRTNHSQSQSNRSRSKSKDQEKSQTTSKGSAIHSDLKLIRNHSRTGSTSYSDSQSRSRTHSRSGSRSHSQSDSQSRSNRYKSRSRTHSQTGSRSHPKSESSSGSHSRTGSKPHSRSVLFV